MPLYRRGSGPIAACVLLVSAACTTPSDSSRTSSPEAPHTSGSAPAAASVSLERFADQDLTWTQCEDFATRPHQKDAYASPLLECARLTVPLDYADADPDAHSVSLGVLRKRATAPDERIGTVIGVPGGDGFGMDLAALHLASGGKDGDLNRRWMSSAWTAGGSESHSPSSPAYRR